MPKAEELWLKKKNGNLVPVYSSHAVFKGSGEKIQMFCMDIDLRYLKSVQEKKDKYLLRLNKIYETSQVFNEETDFEILIDKIIKKAAELLDSESGFIYLYDKKRNILELIIEYPYTTNLGTKLNFGEGMAGKVVKSGESLIVNNYDEWEGKSPQYDGYYLTDIIEVPMYFNGEIIGVLGVKNRHFSKNQYNKEDIKLLELFATYSSIALKKAKIIEDLEIKLENKKIEELRSKKITSELEEQKGDLEDLVHILSHDLKNPMINISGFSQEAQNSIELLKDKISNLKSVSEKSELIDIIDNDIKASLNIISESSKNLKNFTEGILDISRIDNKTLNKSIVDVNKILEELLKDLKYQISEKNIRIKIKKLPNCWGDPFLIKQAFTNLISNSIKFCKNENSVISIKGRVEENCKFTEYIVEDNGIGIEESYLSKIFDLFISSSLNNEGRGLGLSIVKRIIDKHGGSIKVESEVDKFTRFRLKLKKSI